MNPPEKGEGQQGGHGPQEGGGPIPNIESFSFSSYKPPGAQAAPVDPQQLQSQRGAQSFVFLQIGVHIHKLRSYLRIIFTYYFHYMLRVHGGHIWLAKEGLF